jgi:hypothetical protein
MIKIFHIFFLLFFFICSCNYVFGKDSIKIVTREEWWANENFKYIESLEWQKIISDTNKKLKENNEFISEQETIKFLQKPDYNERIETYLRVFFWDKRKIEDSSTHENSKELFWPIVRSQKITGIVIHHTAWEYDDPYESIREIYKFHTLDRKWGDIGYNFLIADDGTIFEWRAWWEKAVAAHTKRNNIWNIGISLMWNYNHDHIPEKQQKSLEQLMKYIIEKYEINIHTKKYFHEDCIKSECKYGIDSQLDFPIIAHRDSSTSTCPWEVGYQDFLKLRENILRSYKIVDINSDKFSNIFNKYPEKKLRYLYHRLVIKKQSEDNFKRKMIYIHILLILKEHIDNKYI